MARRFLSAIAAMAILAALLFTQPSLVRADIYYFVDERGRLYFSDIKKDDRYRLYIKEGGAVVESERIRVVGTYHLSNATSEEVEEKIQEMADRFRMDPELIRAVIKVESNFDPNAVSRAGARGLMQIMPDLARRYGVTDVHDPEQNLSAGIRHLQELLEFFKDDLRMALAAYNAGLTAVIRYEGIPPYPQTKNYVQDVLRYYQYYREKGR